MGPYQELDRVPGLPQKYHWRRLCFELPDPGLEDQHSEETHRYLPGTTKDPLGDFFPHERHLRWIYEGSVHASHPFFRGKVVVVCPINFIFQRKPRVCALL